MAHSINNIQLDLYIQSEKYNDDIERNIHLRFQKKVLEPIDALLARLPLSPLYNYVIPLINIEQKVVSLSELDQQFDKIKESILQSIKLQLNTLSPQFKKRIVASPAEYCKQFVLPYIVEGKHPAYTDALAWKQLLANTSLEEVLQVAKQSSQVWSLNSVRRLVDIYGAAKLIATGVSTFAQKKEVVKKLFLNFGLDKSRFKKIDFTNDSFLEQFNQHFLQSEQEKNISKNQLEMSLVTILLQQEGINIVQPNTMNQEIKDDALKTKKDRQVDAIDQAIVQNEILLENAGMFLLHPFVPQLFSILKIADTKKITDYNKAAAVLHYLATGHSERFNRTMNSERIFLGIEPEAFISTAEPLTKVEMRECNELLQHIIQLWSALQNSSPDTLRELFLQRSAIAMHTDTQWVVNLESRPYDILLDKIPWGISTLKLPWSEKIITLKFKK